MQNKDAKKERGYLGIVVSLDNFVKLFFIFFLTPYAFNIPCPQDP
ncbi:MAG: hypothetical protein SCALA701_14300 [Candidatus Scalindua sp.]|nr:MAG: hypothetical protein SCALA701_14300 [Candidatus Scalindua sp.]